MIRVSCSGNHEYTQLKKKGVLIMVQLISSNRLILSIDILCIIVLLLKFINRNSINSLNKNYHQFNLAPLYIMVPSTLCSLCQKPQPPFPGQSETSIHSCDLCFRLIKANSSIMVTNIETHDIILFSETEVSTIDSLDKVDEDYHLPLEIEKYIQSIKSISSPKTGSFDGIVKFLNEKYILEVERVVSLWKTATESIKQVVNQTKKNPLEAKSSNHPASQNLLHLLHKPNSKQPKDSIQQKLLVLIKNIHKNNPQVLFSQQFSLKSELETLKLKEAKGFPETKRESIFNRNHFSHNVSLENSIEKFIPTLELTKKKSHKNISSIVCSGVPSHYKPNTKITSTKNQIEWLLTNLQHNPQGFRDTNNGGNTSRKVPTQPMTECISEALKATVTNSNSLSLTGFDISKLTFDCYLNMAQWSNSMTSIKLVKVGMSDCQFNLLLCFVARHENLKNIVVTNNHLTEESLHMLLNFVKKIKQIQKVYMGNNPIKALMGKQLIKEIKGYGIQSIYI